MHFNSKFNLFWPVILTVFFLSGCGAISNITKIAPDKKLALKRVGVVSIASDYSDYWMPGDSQATPSLVLEESLKVIAQKLTGATVLPIQASNAERRLAWGTSPNAISAIGSFGEKAAFFSRLKQVAAEQNLDAIFLIRDLEWQGSGNMFVPFPTGYWGVRITQKGDPASGADRAAYIGVSLMVQMLDVKSLEVIAARPAASPVVSSKITGMDYTRVKDDTRLIVFNSVFHALMRMGI